MKATWIKANGTWKQVKNVWQKVNGVWKKGVMPKVKISGTWKELMSYFEKGVVFMEQQDNKYYLRIADYNLNILKSFEVKIDVFSNINFGQGDGKYFYITHGSSISGANSRISKISKQDGIVCTKDLSTGDVPSINLIAVPDKGANFFINSTKKFTSLELYNKNDLQYVTSIDGIGLNKTKLFPQKNGDVIFQDNEAILYVYNNIGLKVSQRSLGIGGTLVGITDEHIYFAEQIRYYNYSLDPAERYKLDLIVYERGTLKELGRRNIFKDLEFNSIPSLSAKWVVEVVGDYVYYIDYNRYVNCCNKTLSTLYWSRSYEIEYWNHSKIHFVDSEKSIWVYEDNKTKKIKINGLSTTYNNRIYGDFAGYPTAFPQNFK
ncbi:hypothetical protein [Hathewaya massiliensis]|uniref:hypothetical protein n=1 Tax=Hathewaya massiliensis TaxID=1964382 RepID=UPI0011587DE4|nr:hypothetical protein [Hathewaya massiliensis]